MNVKQDIHLKQKTDNVTISWTTKGKVKITLKTQKPTKYIIQWINKKMKQKVNSNNTEKTLNIFFRT